jgi:hypothetical protein
MLNFLIASVTSSLGEFVDQVNKIEMVDENYFIAGDAGLLKLDSNKNVLFVNRDLMNVEKIGFVNIDNDSADEIFVSNWLTFAIIDDDGKTIVRQDVSSSSSQSLAVDYYMDSGELKVIVADQNSYGESIWQYRYSSTQEMFVYEWLQPTLEYSNVFANSIKVRNDKLYSMQTLVYGEESHIYEHSPDDGAVLKDLQTTYPLMAYEVDSAKNLLLVGTDNNLSIYDLNTFSFLTVADVDTTVKNIKFYNDYILVMANNQAGWNDATISKTYLFEYKDGVLTQKFVYDSGIKEVKSSQIDANGVILGIETSVVKLTFEGIKSHEYDLSYGKNYGVESVDAIKGDIVASLDIHQLLDDNTTQTLYTNGYLITKVEFVNVDNDSAKEVIASDGRRTYLYDDDESLLWSKFFGTTKVLESDVNNDGVLDLVFLEDGNILALDVHGETLYELVNGQILNFDIKDIDNDGDKDLAYISYGSSGDIVTVTDMDGNQQLEHNIYFPATNIWLFSYIPSEDGSSYSILVNVGYTYIVNLDGSQQYVNYDDNFVNEYYRSAIIEGNNLIRSQKNYDTQKYGIKINHIYPDPSVTTEVQFDVTDSEIRGISLFDYEQDGENEILIADGQSLYLYKLDGTKMWEYSSDVDLQGLEENHFTHIKPLYQSDGNHKIFVSGYSLYEFDKDGNFLEKFKQSEHYMVSSGGTYANPFDVDLNGNIIFGQMGLFNVDLQLVNTLTDSSVSIVQGWNLISLPLDTTISFSDIPTKFPHAQTVWKYNGGWKAYGKGNIQDTLSGEGITKFDSITKEQGFWVNSSAIDTLEVLGNSYDITASVSLTSASKGWHLLGTGTDTSAALIASSNSNISTIWVYSNGWKAYGVGDLADLLSTIGMQTFDNIKQGQGFWVNIK